MAKFKISKRTNGEFQFNLVANNGEIILTSEGYSSRAGCDNGIASVRQNAPQDGNYLRKKSSDGKSYFNLRSGNNQVIGTSEMYESAVSMEKGIASVKANAAGAIVEG
ncbi:MAG TPA: YegP family protein [Cyclobacteriaceae bacterium]|nr:YegP family protein [Cyclobacteriaceae bacterium]